MKDVKDVLADAKTDFRQYYCMIRNQQNMLEDHVRTGGYQQGILQNAKDFKGKVVLDVGAGSGILSMFAAKAGARKVYAVEASDMALSARKLIKANGLEHIVTVVHGRLEEVDIPEKVDIIVSEPIGVLLVHERMLESYVAARDKFLRPGGLMFPGRSRISVAPFSDSTLYTEQQNKSAFWTSANYYGIDVTSLHSDAEKEQFCQPVVGMFDPNLLISSDPCHHPIDFATITPKELHNITIPFQCTVNKTALCHGLATWFDFSFVGTDAVVTIDTSPAAPVTHWQQCRLLLRDPIAVNASQTLSGTLHMVVNEFLSYDVTLEMSLDGTKITSKNEYQLQNQLYYYTPAATAAYQAYPTTPAAS